MNPVIILEKSPSFEDMSTMRKRMALDLKDSHGLEEPDPFVFFLKDASSQVQGGCTGHIQTGCVFIGYLWVDKSYQRQGHGTQLLKAAEDLGRQQGCHLVSITSLFDNVLNFYQQMGYQLAFQRKGLNNLGFYLLFKNLPAIKY